MTKCAKPRRLRGRKGLAVATALLGLLGVALSGDGYVPTFPWDSYYPEHGRERRWSPAIWPPGGTLSVAIAEEGWSDLPPDADFHSAEEVKPLVDRALAHWSAVERADILWKVDSIRPLWPHNADPLPALWDYAITVRTMEGDGWPYAVAAVRATGFDAVAMIDRCAVLMGKWIPWSRDRFYGALVHELGHCLGLRHSASYPHDGGAWNFLPTLASPPEPHVPPVWGRPGVMSDLLYLNRRHWNNTLSLDDEVGASVWRPRAGWVEETGSMWGAVFVGGEPAQGVYVLASTVAPGTGQVGAGVGAFTDEFGIFVIEGLDPGEYPLWVFDLDHLKFSPSFIWGESRIDPEPHIFDTIRSSPVMVRAGERAGPLLIPVRRPEVDE